MRIALSPIYIPFTKRPSFLTLGEYMKRKGFLIKGFLGMIGLTGTHAAQKHPHPTPKEIEGPFYPVQAQKDKDFDLTKFGDQQEAAKGTHIFIKGEVIDQDGNPVEDATVDLWQANTHGRYRHPHDTSNGKLDPYFQGWAIVQSGEKGGFNFKTVYPGAYAVGKNWTRPPHIHFKVSKRGYEELVTQMYFPEHPLNGKDHLINKKSDEEKKLMVAKLSDEKTRTYFYQIILKKV